MSDWFDAGRASVRRGAPDRRFVTYRLEAMMRQVDRRGSGFARTSHVIRLHAGKPDQLDGSVRVNRSDAGPRPRILVIESDLVTRETLALTLQYYDYDVTVAGNGTEATALLPQMTPDVVVMDWRTQGLSGLPLCLALRRRFPMMPIVVVTSLDEIFDGEQPVNAWLRKPIDPPLLNRVIRNELAPVRSS